MYRLIGRTSHVIYRAPTMEELYDFAQQNVWIRCEYQDSRRKLWHDCTQAFEYMIHEYAMAEEQYERRVAGELESIERYSRAKIIASQDGGTS